MNLTQGQINSLKNNFQAALSKMIEAIEKKAIERAYYNLEVNIPKGIVLPQEMVDECLSYALIHTITTDICGFGVEPAINVASKILEDVNAHAENAALMKKAVSNGLGVDSAEYWKKELAKDGLEELRAVYGGN